MPDPKTFGQAPNGSGYMPSFGLGECESSYVLAWNGAIRPAYIHQAQGITFRQDVNRSLTQDFNFDLSKSNSIYGASQKIQPRNFQSLIIIKA